MSLQVVPIPNSGSLIAFLDKSNVHHFHTTRNKVLVMKLNATDKDSLFSIYGDRNNGKDLAAEGSTSLFV
jgi:hypothetical protein